jgi:hypothetical protein
VPAAFLIEPHRERAFGCGILNNKVKIFKAIRRFACLPQVFTRREIQQHGFSRALSREAKTNTLNGNTPLPALKLATYVAMDSKDLEFELIFYENSVEEKNSHFVSGGCSCGRGTGQP